MKEELRLHEAITIWADNPSKNKDATYSVQLFENDLGKYFVQAQFGRRGAIQTVAKNRGNPYHYEGMSFSAAQGVYDDLVWKKKRGGYTQPHKTILPAIFKAITSKTVKPKKHTAKLNEFMNSGDETKKPFGLEALWRKN